MYVQVYLQSSLKALVAKTSLICIIFEWDSLFHKSIRTKHFSLEIVNPGDIYYKMRINLKFKNVAYLNTNHEFFLNNT